MEKIMKTKTAATKTNVSSRSDSKADVQVYTVGMATLGISACVIGLWAFASLIGGMVASGGPFALVGSWFKAVFGL